jgi:hypothetical protein
MDRFQAEGSDSFIFLLSTRAGGLGITLTAVSNCKRNADGAPHHFPSRLSSSFGLPTLVCKVEEPSETAKAYFAESGGGLEKDHSSKCLAPRLSFKGVLPVRRKHHASTKYS